MIHVASCRSLSYLVFFLTKEKHEEKVAIEEEHKNQKLELKTGNWEEGRGVDEGGRD